MNNSSQSATDAGITSLTALELSAAIADRRVSCRETMAAYLSRIDQLNPRFNAIVSMTDPDLLLKQAEEADQELTAGNYRGWMHGMPHAVKDLADVRGMVTSFGSPVFPQSDCCGRFGTYLPNSRCRRYFCRQNQCPRIRAWFSVLQSGVRHHPETPMTLRPPPAAAAAERQQDWQLQMLPVADGKRFHGVAAQSRCV